MQIISLFYNRDKEEAVRIAGIVKEKAEAAGMKLKEDDIDERTALAVSVGGDGTVLAAARKAAPNGVPLAHINTGTLGFIGAEPESVTDYIESLLDFKADFEERVMLSAVTGSGFEVSALNDIVIKNGSTARLINLELFINGTPACEIRGDGIIISTPTGSTAYSLAAGGPVAEPGLKLMVISPLNPHSLNSRSLVLDPGSRLLVRAPEKGDEVILTADGQVSRVLSPPEDVSVSVSGFGLMLAKTEKNFFDLLANKMNWGV